MRKSLLSPKEEAYRNPASFADTFLEILVEGTERVALQSLTK